MIEMLETGIAMAFPVSKPLASVSALAELSLFTCFTKVKFLPPTHPSLHGFSCESFRKFVPIWTRTRQSGPWRSATGSECAHSVQSAMQIPCLPPLTLPNCLTERPPRPDRKHESVASPIALASYRRCGRLVASLYLYEHCNFPILSLLPSRWILPQGGIGC